MKVTVEQQILILIFKKACLSKWNPKGPLTPLTVVCGDEVYIDRTGQEDSPPPLPNAQILT